LVIGVTGVSAYKVEKDLSLAPGEKAQIADYSFEYMGARPVAGPNYDAIEGRVVIRKHDMLVDELTTQKRTFRAQHQPMTQAGISVGWSRDLFVALGEDLGAGKWSMRIQYKPLVRFIWLGALIMALGGLIAVMDRRYRSVAKGA
jgi:cytochrome c-type biogenesis protein CcmF